MPRLSPLAALLLLPATPEAQAEDRPEAAPAPEPAMTLDRLGAILAALDPEAEDNGKVWQLTIDGVRILVVTDTAADRMRAIAPVARQSDVTGAQMTRMMQANFDTALDARYAIGKDILWSAYIHPLSPLQKNQLISGLGQVVNLARSYGTLYSSGGLQYGGGDSGALQRQLIEDLLEKGEDV